MNGLDATSETSETFETSAFVASLLVCSVSIEVSGMAAFQTRWRRQSSLGLRNPVRVEPRAPQPTEAQPRIKSQNGKKSYQADHVGVDLASSKLGSIAQPLPNLAIVTRGGLPSESLIRQIASAIKKTTAEKLDGR